MPGFGPWHQPADITFDVFIPRTNTEAAWSTGVSFPAHTPDALLDMALAAQRGDLAIMGGGTPITPVDVAAALISGGRHFDDEDNPGGNYTIAGMSAFPPLVGVGFASDFQIPTLFGPAWSAASQAETSLFTLMDQSGAYTHVAGAVFDDPSLTDLFDNSYEYEVEHRLYADTPDYASSYVIPGSHQLIYRVEPQTTDPWNLDLYMYNPDNFPGHVAFWHVHEDLVATLFIEDNTVWDGIGILPESSFPTGFVTVSGTGTLFGSTPLYNEFLPYRRRLSAIHREALALDASYAGLGLTSSETLQRASVDGMYARVTLRPSRIRFTADGCTGNRLHYMSKQENLWKSIAKTDGETILKYNDPITRTWQPVCGSGSPIYYKDRVTDSWVSLCCLNTDYADPVAGGSGGSGQGGGGDAGGGGGSDGSSGGGPGGGGDPGGGAGEGLAGAEIPVGWHQTFFDDFNGSSVDSSKWNVRNNSSNSNEQSYLLARNVSVSGSMLRVTAKRESVGGKNYTSGYLDSIGKFSQKYGIWRVKAKVNTPVGTSQGIWPAPLWLRGNSCGMEIDLIETWGVGPGGGMSWYAGHEGSGSASIHQNTNGGQGKVSGWLASGAYDLSVDFHVYECEWSPTDIWIRRNGVNWVHATPSNAPWAFSGPDFGCPANMRINLQISKEGALYGAPVSSTTFPTTMLIDWIQVLAHD